MLEVEDVGASFPHRVAYHPTCHSLRLLKVGERPLRLLRAVQGIDLVEIEQAQECCGFGGTFAVKNADTSMAMLSDKLRHVLDTCAAKFLSVGVAVSGANFGIAETGTICVVESEGNGRMCTTLPEVLVTVMGIEKVLPEWQDLEVFLQLLPRSSTAERMNPYTSLWTGVRDGDGPREFHLVLLDNGRTDVLRDEVGRQALHCIRCSACLNVCPVYSRTGGQAYESVYPGPIGAILTPQLKGLEQAPTLPWASSLCGACYEACPVKIDIPSVLIHLRARVVAEEQSRWEPERLAMDAVGGVFGSRKRYEAAQRLSRARPRPAARSCPCRGWTAMRELPEVPPQTFREWWRERSAG